MAGKGHSDPVKKLESRNLGPDLGLSLTWLWGLKRFASSLQACFLLSKMKKVTLEGSIRTLRILSLWILGT